ncbi:MAG: ElyC/SanA/YdcF family protein [Chloroflexota bacterium]|nr:ElyC/SanA/YdcF family protein [Chloroflexota bacterium]
MLFRKLIRTLFHIAVYAVIASFFLMGFMRAGILIYAKPKTAIPAEAPSAPVALVLGAGLNRDGTAGVVLQDRVEAAADLYFAGKVQKLLMSGDNSSDYYDEPGAMKEHALSLGVPDEDIVLDFAGRRTYDSCYRAKAIFGLEELIVVTQAFHLPRALFLCNAFDIRAKGVVADDANYRLRSYTYWWVREIFATLKAYWDIWVAHPVPILGEPEPIFLNN